jgi:hypothetical protein
MIKAKWLAVSAALDLLAASEILSCFELQEKADLDPIRACIEKNVMPSFALVQSICPLLSFVVVLELELELVLVLASLVNQRLAPNSPLQRATGIIGGSPGKPRSAIHCAGERLRFTSRLRDISRRA